MPKIKQKRKGFQKFPLTIILLGPILWVIFAKIFPKVKKVNKKLTPIFYLVLGILILPFTGFKLIGIGVYCFVMTIISEVFIKNI
ncbi:MAG: hypothetical protein GYA51_02450 [Candidatus Methanofastidiosa archaeon]|nr:hypothetical protein [Candidatus Methanofastidiosa archaeon]